MQIVFISYCVIQSLKSEPNYEKAIFESDYLDELITPIINEKLPQIILQMNTLYADSYPANIFKNTGKCKEIYRQLTLENDHLD